MVVASAVVAEVVVVSVVVCVAAAVVAAAADTVPVSVASQLALASALGAVEGTSAAASDPGPARPEAAGEAEVAAPG